MFLAANVIGHRVTGKQHVHDCYVQADVERRALNIEGCHTVGGTLAPTFHDTEGLEEMSFRIFIDTSLVEVFTSTGEATTSSILDNTVAKRESWLA